MTACALRAQSCWAAVIPRRFPEMNEYFQTLLADMLANGKALDALCNYDGPQGKKRASDSAGADAARRTGLGD